MSRYVSFVALGAISLLALATPFLPLHDPTQMDIVHRMAPPSAVYWLGQDEFGRDILSRLLWGARISLAVAFATAVFACLIGGALGIIAGFFGGWLSSVVMRATDVILSLPHILVAMLIVTLFGAGIETLIPILVFVYIPGFVRVAQVSTAMIRSNAFVEAVGVLGAGKIRTLIRTVVPNVGGPLLVQMSLIASSAIMLESGLSFLGLGVQPPAPSWGTMIGNARNVMGLAPMLLVWPCLALVLAVLSINAVVDSLRDILDPQKIATSPRKFFLRRVAAATVEPDDADNLLELRRLELRLKGGDRNFELVRGVDLSLAPSETLAIVGESGSGKSLTGLALAGLLPEAIGVAGGSARFEGRDILSMNDQELRELRGAKVAMIFQDPLSSLNPVYTVGRQLAEAVLAHGHLGRGEAAAKAIELLRRVEIPDPAVRARNYPHEMSGGMRQRVMIAMAIANDPSLVIADEPTTSLDVTVQAQILDLLRDLKEDRGLAVIFISHSLPVVSEIADRVAVMYCGEIVEEGPTDVLLRQPLHPYTRALIESCPKGDELPVGIPGLVPTPDALPAGCAFSTRCAYAQDACHATRPTLDKVASNHRTRCFRWMELT